MTTKFNSFLKRATKRVLFFKHPIEQAVFKSTPKDGYFVKLGDNTEYQAEDGSKLVFDALIELEEITAEEYENVGVY